MQDQRYELSGKIWLWSGGKTSWHFITLPKPESERIKFLSSDRKVGFGSVRVKVKIGNTEWKTSIFPSKEADAYILPIKADVRKNEQIGEGDKVTFSIDIIS